MSKNDNDNLFSNSNKENEENYRKPFYEKLKKTKPKIIESKSKAFYV